MSEYEAHAGVQLGIAGEREMSAIQILTCIVVTPEMTVRESPAQFVVVPLYDGELGIALGIAP